MMVFNIHPGGCYRFPPLKADQPLPTQVDEPIPQFDAIVGNFPYISADRIEQAKKGYIKDVIYRTLVSEWFKAYPSGFRLPGKSTGGEQKVLREKPCKLIVICRILNRTFPVIPTFTHTSSGMRLPC